MKRKIVAMEEIPGVAGAFGRERPEHHDPVNGTGQPPVKADGVSKEAMLEWVLQRLRIRIIFDLGRKDWQGNKLFGVVEALNSAQASESYARKVWLHPEPEEAEEFLLGERSLRKEPEVFGSHRWWSGDTDRLVGEGSAACLKVRGNSLVVVQQSYNEAEEEGSWNGPTERKICSVDSIVKMEFETTSGWRGECYPERVYPGGFDYWDQPFTEGLWICILHRSTGAVTIDRGKSRF